MSRLSILATYLLILTIQFSYAENYNSSGNIVYRDVLRMGKMFSVIDIKGDTGLRVGDIEVPSQSCFKSEFYCFESRDSQFIFYVPKKGALRPDQEWTVNRQKFRVIEQVYINWNKPTQSAWLIRGNIIQGKFKFVKRIVNNYYIYSREAGLVMFYLKAKKRDCFNCIEADAAYILTSGDVGFGASKN